MLCFYFHLSKDISSFPLDFFFDPLAVWVCCLISTYLWIVQFFFHRWFLLSFHCDRKRYFVWFQSFKIYLIVFVFCGLTYPGECSIWTWQKCAFCCCWMLCSVYICWSDGLVVMFKASISLLIFCLAVPSIMESSILKSPPIFTERFLPSILSMFASHILELWCVIHVWRVYLLGEWILLSMYNVLLITVLTFFLTS